MIGNDLVDLSSAKQTHPRFDSRVFADSERDMIEQSTDPMRARWMFWAAKEAAFKALRRMDSRLPFSPRCFVCGPIRGHKANLIHQQHDLTVHFFNGPDYVHAIAQTRSETEPFHALRCFDFALDSDAQSIEVRRLVREQLAKRWGIAASNITIERKRRMPWLHIGDLQRGLPVSLSHHGRFVAFACA